MARALHDHGWDVTLFEREVGLSGAGTALGMWPSALAALDRIGVGEAVRSRGTPQDSAVFLRPDGTTIGTLDASRLARRTGDQVHLLSRPALLAQLQQAAPGSALRFGEAVNDLGVLREKHDVVVAADGIFSRTRTSLFGDAYQARYTGVTAWRGWLDDRPTHTLTETWGTGSKFGITPQEGGRTNWYATTVAPERSFTSGRELDRLRELFGSWRGPVGSLLPAITEEGILRHDLYVVPALPSFVTSNVALIGDAAHAMTPDLGQGGCQALEDAVELGAALARHRPQPEALAAYDAARRPRAQAVARRSRALGRIAQSAGIAAVVRDAAVHLTAARLTDRGVDRLLAWTPPAARDP
jgi:2-polyprenyl-6-methoxyphenol hydroxylase-like FAD-dependent oxidoreductase